MTCPNCGNKFNAVHTYYNPDKGLVDQWRCNNCGHTWEEDE